MDLGLSGKVALVAASSRGLGRAVAEELAREGMSLVLCARGAEALRAGIEGVGRRLGYPAGLITVSIGLAQFDPGHPGEGDLLVAADRALYRAKAAGRNAVA